MRFDGLGSRAWELHGQRRRRLELGLSQLAGDYAQLPALCRLGPGNGCFVSDLRFDAGGELLASCTTSGTVAVHQLEQFTSSTGAALAAVPESDRS